MELYSTILLSVLLMQQTVSLPLNGTSVTVTNSTVATTPTTTSTIPTTIPTTTSTTPTTTTTTPTTTSATPTTTTTTPTTTSTTPTTTTTTPTTISTTPTTTTTTPTTTSTTPTTTSTASKTTSTTSSTIPTVTVTNPKTTTPTTIKTTTTQQITTTKDGSVTLKLNSSSVEEFVKCPITISYCQNNGECYQNTRKNNERFCRCKENFYGEFCETEALDIYRYLLYGVVAFAAIALMFAVVTSCQLYVKKGDVDNIKREKFELEVYYQRKICNSRTGTFNDSASTTGSVVEISSPENSKYLLNATRIIAEQQKQDQNQNNNQLEEDIVIATPDPAFEERRFRSRSLDSDLSLKYYYDVKDGSGSEADTNSLHSTGLLIPPNYKIRAKSWDGSENEVASEASYDNYGADMDDEIKRTKRYSTPPIDSRGYIVEPPYAKTVDRRQQQRPSNIPHHYRNKSPNHHNQLRKYNSRSLQDLRVTAINANLEQNGHRVAHSGRVSKATSSEKLAYHQQGGHTKPKGIWASSQDRINGLK